MSEQLFKLKKDGRCVGFMRFQKHTKPEYHGNRITLEFSRGGRDWFPNNILSLSTINGANEPPDEICPYVTTDKNGDKVFAFDRCMGLCDNDGGTIEGEVITDGTNKIGMPVAPYIEDREGEQRYLAEFESLILIEPKEEKIIAAAKKTARTGNRKDLQNYLRFRREK